MCRVAMSMTLTTWSSSWVATIWVPSGVKNTSSGRTKVWPGARSPGRGNSHSVRPCGSMSTSRLLSSSATRTGPGSTCGSEPGARNAPVSGESRASAPAMVPVTGVVAGFVAGVVAAGEDPRDGTDPEVVEPGALTGVLEHDCLLYTSPSPRD